VMSVLGNLNLTWPENTKEYLELIIKANNLEYAACPIFRLTVYQKTAIRFPNSDKSRGWG